MFDKMSEAKSGPVSRRPMSAVTRMTSASRMTNVPEIAKMKLMMVANEIYRSRPAISDILSA